MAGRRIKRRASVAVNPAVLLMEPGFAAHTRSVLAGDQPFSLALEGPTAEQQVWLEQRWLGLAGVLDLQPQLASGSDETVILIREEPAEFGIEGLSLQTERGWLVQWAPIAMGGESGDRHTKMHELGHTLGLSHPESKPESKLYNTATTLMSYRKGPRGWDDAFQQADLAALQQLWNPAVCADGVMPWFTSRGNALVPLGQRLEASSDGSVLNGSPLGDLMIGGAGPDEFYGHSGRDWLTGAEGSDQLWGGPDADMLIGGSGADWIDTGGGADIVASCRDGDRDVICLPARTSRRAVPLIEALDRVDRIELVGAPRQAALTVSPTRLDGLDGLGVSLNGRLAVVVADPWLSARQLAALIVLA